MAVSERLRYFRTKRKMTAMQLGMELGFPPGSAGNRITQYERNYRNPGPQHLRALAEALQICPEALTAPTFETETDILHILFALEDLYGLTVHNFGNLKILYIEDSMVKANRLKRLISLWSDKRMDLMTGRISPQEYNEWKWNFK